MENQQQAKQNISIRRLTVDDQPKLLALLQDRQLAASAGLQLSADSQFQRWVIQNWLIQAELYGIWHGSQLVGVVTIFPYQNGGEIGYFIQPSFRHQHIMTMAVGKVLQVTQFRVIRAEVAVNNVASQHVLITNGFKLKANLPQLFQYYWLGN
ncbi:GNAT family N-acetyltransferase [uncultured Limosilactobacillus sp.]|uniref:GNAT family N-acetyltransferase n=1 Tax=uncultured Limosilactobacillus sp. TaxID=2837629 RepID=UPI0025FE2D29|nr:GNAT family N-acetyltransferase [uncultured Limosilactobacillus sp.]